MAIFTTLNTIIEDILKTARGSIISSSEPVSKRQIEDWVHQYRAVLLKRDLDKNNYPNPDYIQEIPKLELETVQLGNITYLATTLNLPKTINMNIKSGYAWIGTLDGKELQLVPQHREQWQEYKRYTSNDVLCFLKDNKLYFRYNDPSINYITVRGIFENPMEVGRFVNPETNLPYTNYDSPYPIPNSMLDPLKKMIFESELNITLQAPSDTKNDSNHGVDQNEEHKFIG
jgi:hypothetical protein